jgi:hypothetical protein
VAASPGKWNAEQVRTRARALVSRNLDVAGLFLRDEIKRDINRGNIRGTDPSAPGEPPKKVSGELFRSVVAHPVEARGTMLVKRVGAGKVYARRLELGFVGTDKAGRRVSQAARPFVRPAIRRNRRVLGILVATGKRV